MPRPTTKADLLQQSAANYARLLAFVDALPAATRHAAFPDGYLNRNVRDVLAHLHHWHLLMGDWYRVGMAGGMPDMPAAGYTWKTTADLNRAIRDRYRDTDLDAVRAQLEESYRAVRALIEAHSDEELFTKKRYPWTGSTSLGAYLVSSTSSHYDWAYKLIRKALR